MACTFADKIIVVTGAGSGIGRATSIKLSKLGATLALSDINPESLAESLTLCAPGDYLTSAFDVGSTGACNAFIISVAQKFKRIDHVFNCAGINPTAIATTKIADEYWDKMMDTNLKGLFTITRAAILYMPSGSSFVNVSSLCGLQAKPGFAVYCATKFGIIGFSKCMALELGPKGIRTNIVAPGYIDTPTNASVVAGKESMQRANKGVALGRMGEPEEVADVVAFLMSSKARYMNGSVVEINGGIT